MKGFCLGFMAYKKGSTINVYEREIDSGGKQFSGEPSKHEKLLSDENGRRKPAFSTSKSRPMYILSFFLFL